VPKSIAISHSTFQLTHQPSNYYFLQYSIS